MQKYVLRRTSPRDRLASSHTCASPILGIAAHNDFGTVAQGGPQKARRRQARFADTCQGGVVAEIG